MVLRMRLRAAKVDIAQREVTMSYQALYRKWRPDNFNDVKGQDTIVTTLRNQINADRIGHAYLFCGTRGTGRHQLPRYLRRQLIVSIRLTATLVESARHARRLRLEQA